MADQLPYALVTDFDGTITRKDFFEVAIERFVGEPARRIWGEYWAGRLTHFEGMREIYKLIRCDEFALVRALDGVDFDPRFGEALAALRGAGWEVIVVSAGCDWYIRRLLDGNGPLVTLHTNRSAFRPGKGLFMEAPLDSPFYSPTHGVDKLAVVRHAIASHERVAFAGDGRPDLDAAMQVPPDLRFARRWLEAELRRRAVPFRPFDRWSEIAGALAPARPGG